MRIYILFFVFVFYYTTVFANDIFLFLENISNSQDTISKDFLEEEKLSNLEKDVYSFFTAKNLFAEKKFSATKKSIKNSPDPLYKITVNSLSEELLKNFSVYSSSDIISSLDLFSEVVNNLDLVLTLKDKLPNPYNKKIYKQLWLKGKIKSKEINKDNDFLNTNKEYLQHLNSLYKEREYNYLLKQFPKIASRFKKDKENYTEYLYQYARLLKKKRNYQKALNTLAPAKKTKKVLGAEFQLKLILKKEKEAHRMINRLKSQVSPKIINELRYQFADYHFRNRNYDKAIYRYQKINWQHLSQKKKEQGLWQTFYSNVKEKPKAQVVPFYQQVKKNKFFYTNYAAGICYWGEKIQARLKNAMHPCFRPYILSYYGWTSLGDEKINFLKIAPINKELDFSQDKEMLLIKKVYDLQEVKFANYLVWNYIVNPKTVQNFQRAANLLFESQNYQQLILLANYYQNLQKNPAIIRQWLQSYFPLAYKEKIIPLAKKNNLDPALILALIREESHFNSTIISSAGAIGIMQLMPFTARDIAARKKISLGITNFVKKVQDIDLNLDFGITYLAWEIDRFKNQIPYALAAYNGGGGNVRKWQKNKHKDFDYWLEAIPFLETNVLVLSSKDIIVPFGKRHSATF